MTLTLTSALALFVTAAGIGAAAITWALTRRHRPALPLLLDFLLAAGLLRLTSDQSWTAIASTALIVGLRKLSTSGIGRAATARSPRPQRASRTGP